MRKNPTNKLNNGFTLIELMVVISIIGVLSSVTISSLASTRLKARDAKIIQQVNQMRTLLEFEKSDSNSYANLLPLNWVSTQAGCNGFFSGTYAAKAREICGAIVTNSASNFAGATSFAYFGPNTGTYSVVSNYSIMAYLPGAQVFYCVGSSGRNSKNTTTTAWTNPGCYNNP